MKVKGKRLSGYLQKLKNGLSNPKLLVFTFFLFVSVVFWLINSLSDKYTTEIVYPVRFINNYQRKVLITKLPERLSIRAEAFGYSLLKAKLNAGLKPIIIDFNRCKLKQSSSDTNSYYLITNSALEDIRKQVNSELTIKDVNPDSVFFQFTKRSSRKLPVNLNLMLDYKKPFMRSGEIDISPDSIMVSGPYNQLDSIRFIETIFRKISRIERTQKFTIELKPLEHVSFEHKNVDVTIPVEQFTEFETKIPINVLNKPADIEVKLFPNNVAVTCLVALSDYKRIEKDDFNAVVDYQSIAGNLSNRLNVSIIKLPDYIKRYKFSPKNVEYIIEK